jgi:hypothetical protein
LSNIYLYLRYGEDKKKSIIKLIDPKTGVFFHAVAIAAVFFNSIRGSVYELRDYYST